MMESESRMKHHPPGIHKGRRATRGFTLIDLLVVIFFSSLGGCAAVYTQLVSPWVGSFVGAVVGLPMAFALFRFRVWQNRVNPPCTCGNAERFGIVWDTPLLGHLWACPCGRIHIMNGRRWSEVFPDGTTRLLYRRDFWGKWTPADPKAV
jgi:hypothetical protein